MTLSQPPLPMYVFCEIKRGQYNHGVERLIFIMFGVYQGASKDLNFYVVKFVVKGLGWELGLGLVKNVL